MTPKNRERAYEKRRYEEWQGRLASKQAQTLRVRRRLAIGGVAVTVVLVVVAAFLLLNEGDDETTPAAGSSSSTPSASASADAAASTCPAVEVTAPATPQQFDKVPAKTLADGQDWTLNVATTCGDITIKLDGKAAPQAVSSMIQLAKDGFYDGSPCHRLTTAERFEVLQCGDPTGTGSGSPGYSYGPIENAPAKTFKQGTTTLRTYPEARWRWPGPAATVPAWGASSSWSTATPTSRTTRPAATPCSARSPRVWTW